MAETTANPLNDSIDFGWNTFLANIRYLVTLYLIFFFLGSMITLGQIEAVGVMGPYGGAFLTISNAAKLLSKGAIQEEVFIVIAYILFVLVCELGFIGVSLKLCDGNKPHYSDLFKQYQLLENFIIAYVIYLILILIGYILLVVPGIYLLNKYFFYSYLIVDKNIGPIESLKKSGNITKGKIWTVFEITFAFGVIYFPALVAGYLGLNLLTPIFLHPSESILHPFKSILNLILGVGLYAMQIAFFWVTHISLAYFYRYLMRKDSSILAWIEE